MIWFLFLACKEEPEKEKSELAFYIEDYHHVMKGSAWTYRDDRVTDLDSYPEDDQVLRAQYIEDGTVEFRRGIRWTDANKVGEMTWGTDEFLVLQAWDLPETEGEGEYPISGPEPEEGQLIESGKWTCTAYEIELLETWYGLFEQALEFRCEDNSISATFVFAKNTGLVQLSLEDYALDLVAPW